MTIDFTTVIGVDVKHADELELVWPTWRAHRPELLAQPMLLICDGTLRASDWERRLEFLDHPSRRVVLWDQEGVSQREKMLSGLVFAAAEHLRTPWYLKLDTDAISLEACPWIHDEWFAPSEGQEPVIVASPWGYTKPAHWLSDLDDWGDGISELRDKPRLNLASDGGPRIRHPRVISWLMFGSTSFLRQAAAWCDGRLPIPSQDTFLWYCATRSDSLVRRIFMKGYGWTHGSPHRLLSARRA